MKEKPVLFNAEMVRAILDGRKTQTRRAIKFPIRDKDFGCDLSGSELAGEISSGNYRNSPFGAVGDRLWVRESFYEHGHWQGGGYDPEDSYFVSDKQVLYPADGIQRPTERKREDFWRSRPSIHMPRWASRITLEIAGVRVERLNSISEGDAKSEGLAEITKDGSLFKFGIPDSDGYPGTDDKGWPWTEWERNPVDAYCKLWQSIYGADSWQANPWVWVVEFKRVEGN